MPQACLEEVPRACFERISPACLEPGSRRAILCPVSKVRHRVFICHSSRNATVAREIVDMLEANDVGCWISSRDVEPGANYQEAIVRAIRRAWIVVFLFSDEANRSGEVKKELSLASSFGATVVPMRLATTPPNEALMYELSTCQWIEGTPDFGAGLARLRLAVVEMLREMANSADTVIAGKTPSDPFRGSIAIAPSRAATPRIALSRADLDCLCVLMTRHVGPVARVLVRRALEIANTPDELCRNLAAQVPNAEERAAFLRAALASLPQ